MGLFPSVSEILPGGPVFAFFSSMKAVAVRKSSAETGENFYLANLAPVNHGREKPFEGLDAFMLVVLFVEIAAIARLLLAN